MNRALYSCDEQRDSCGFGLIAHLHGKASHDLLKTAIDSLTSMTHRGGIAADNKTGDGCGLLFTLSEKFFADIASRLFKQSNTKKLAVGMLFLSADTKQAETERCEVNSCLKEHGLAVLGWRQVPVNDQVCGPIAQQNRPQIEQVFVDVGKGSIARAEVKLFIVRKEVERALQEHKSFYICSLSSRLIAYKGLVLPCDLKQFYPDLANENMAASICVFHQRYSTNTQPRWPLAQPFRLLAHNGEINTIQGNRNWAQARAAILKSEQLPDMAQLQPIIEPRGSDSASMDNMLELLLAGGINLYRALRLMIPSAWQPHAETMDPDLRAFYEYSAMHMEPWDGPAGVVLTDGRHAVCLLDRNGLRPARWLLADNDYIVLASETGVYPCEPENVVAKGRIGPGQILSVDTETGQILHTPDIDTVLKRAHPYKQWLQQGVCRVESSLTDSNRVEASLPAGRAEIYAKLFQLTQEETDQVLKVLAETAQEPVGSMGDDTPLAVMSKRSRLLSDYFRQQFAQVTNPAIDPLRESLVMSLDTHLGEKRNLFCETELHAQRALLNSPVLSINKFNQIIEDRVTGFHIEKLELNYHPSFGLEQAIIRLADHAQALAEKGFLILHLSDRNIDKTLLPMNAMLAVGAIHHRLIEKGLRCQVNIIVETALARDAHQFALLIGFGASAVFPYLSYQVLNEMARKGGLVVQERQARVNYRRGINKGLQKILSKMGISTISSYRGAQLFEALGLHDEMIQLCFKGVASRVQGMTFKQLQQEQETVHRDAWQLQFKQEVGGLFKYVHGGEYHAFNPDVVMPLQRAVQTGEDRLYQEYIAQVNQRDPAMLRDLLEPVSDRSPMAIDRVEPVESILKRFETAGMSLGALSPEAHEALALAMNELGGRSNSGEGGEDPARHGTMRRSKIKQVASGRFGVTPSYLMSAEVIQIKIAQGAKPGEGGQLPGGKVNEMIAKLRYSAPGVTLISPPPHHDIYSIEDLAQLIFDLKQINPEAMVSVKLVAEPGVGTIAAGVAKAYADFITISGCDGGTGASPLSSIRYAGSAWELGISEVHQALRHNQLRGRVVLQADGGLKTGLDVVKAAILGAESFGFGTAPMVALGCKYLRICHLNNCATGIATQDQYLRSHHFHGTVDRVKQFFLFVAQETREWLAKLGYQSLEEIIGATDCLRRVPGITDKQQSLDLSLILAKDPQLMNQPYSCQVERNNPPGKTGLASQMFDDILPAIDQRKGGRFRYAITNSDRAIGAQLSGEIAKRYGDLGMSDNPIHIDFEGSAGQSFGVWNCGGLHLHLSGDANDYVGKGMAGGALIIKPPGASRFLSREATIVGNTCLYGATGGILYAAGGAGERFAVRNSGAKAVAESVGDHCCEYMTGGIVTILGETGYNFGAGMTGGFAFVLDMNHRFVDRCNHDLVEIQRLLRGEMEGYRNLLREILKDYVELTSSTWGQELLANFYDYTGQFWLVRPKATTLDKLLMQTRMRPE